MPYTITTTYLDHEGNKRVQKIDESPVRLPETVYTILKSHMNLKHQVLEVTIKWPGGEE